jgi:hypothetical protein
MSDEVCDFHSNGGWFDPEKECYICKEIKELKANNAKLKERVAARNTTIRLLNANFKELENI